ncbi:phosphatidylinositide phosphatase SAC2-like [Ornithodoros turicata]|uniref:phosphatidylinositide phosphatase SAC2-like n=1 Tax=Ornithodoros turicata TaxID=34597 RepID=UPI0031395B8F
MEILMTPEYYVIVDGEYTLWCSRIDGKLEPRKLSELHELTDPVCLGTIYGVIGKFQAHPDSDKRLVVIRQLSLIGCLPGNHEVYKINKVTLIPLCQHEAPDFDLEPCKKHNPNYRRPERSPASEFQQKALQKTWNTIKTATSQVKPRKSFQKENKEKEKYERRVLDELAKMFNDTDSFYFSLCGDLTNSLQRQHNQAHNSSYIMNMPLWKRVDDRFFWNKEMLSDLIELKDPSVDHWILPIIQGFVQVERCFIDAADDSTHEATLGHDSSGVWFDVNPPALRSGKEYTMTLISRRSKHRAGTRYKRRGVDENGKCANYVETEQIFEHGHHIVSFVQIRGSVPVFWSQPGYKYRPPPRLDRDEEETNHAFEKHFTEQLAIYGSQVIINLVEQSGKEKVISDTYLNHVLNFDCPDLTYVTFDFHEYCRGMRFENVSILIENVKDIIRDMRYCWLDQQGLICDQRGVFRVNCIDCLDRTNIVQTAIAKTAMDTQFIRLGLLPPEGVLPTACRRVFQMLWANNGDIISRQYAGTAALKGDFTRTGSRRLAGMMKDGYNSANRYYVNRFKDAYRQATIDIMLGNPVTEDFMAVSPEQEDNDPVMDIQDQEHHEHVKQLIDHCKKILIPESEVVLGGWALIDADPVTGDPGQSDMDSILVLTKDSYYVAEYDDQTDRITKYQKVFLEDLEKIELGPEPSLFKSKHYCVRFHYVVNGQTGYFHMFRSTNTRFFNNMAVPISGEEETIESLKAICESFKVALSVKLLNVPMFEGKLERRRSKLPFIQGNLSGFRNGGRPGGFAPFQLELPCLTSMPRNISEGQLMAFVNVGSRALSNVTSQFAKLNPIRGVRGFSKRPGNGNLGAAATLGVVSEASPAVQRASFQVDSSSDSEDDSIRWLKKHGSSNLPTHVSDRTLSSDYSECSDLDDVSDALDHSASGTALNQDSLLESCGILATSPSLKSSDAEQGADREDDSQRGPRSHIDVDDFVIDAMKRASLRQHLRQRMGSQEGSLDAPQIQISSSEVLRPATEVSIASRSVTRKLSRSSEALDVRPSVPIASSSCEVSHLLVQEDSPRDAEGLSGKMKMSHSESAIQDFSLPPALGLPNPLSSPIVIKKDLVLSPLSRIAKGVQNLGMNLRPAAIGGRRPQPPHESESLRERKHACRSRIIVV